jgi:ATP-dependent Lon protease
MNDEKNSPENPFSPPEKPADLILPDQVLPPNLFVLPVVGSPVFPTLMAPIVVHLPRFIATVEEAISRQRILGLLLVKEGEPRENLKANEMFSTGVVVKILKRIKLPDGSVNLLVHSLKRFRSRRVLSDDPHLVVEAEYLDDLLEKSTEMDALTRSVVANVKKLAEVNPFFTDEMRLAMINAPGPGTVADLVAFALSLPRETAQEFLETTDVKKRFEKLLVHLRREQDVADVQKKISDEVNTKITQMQREFFLKEQMKVIKKELGLEEDGRDKSSRSFRERIESAGLPDAAKKMALNEVEKFETLSESSPEYNIVRNYLDLLCSLPWSIESEERIDIGKARLILDQHHFGLEKVKERIIEFLSVRKLKGDKRGSILCLVGPPGVGKTSIGKSIAETLDRNFFRFSLGGMRDEAEIKGHRRTYVGAMPGKILNGVKRAGSRNCVLMLDEIDKLGASFQGDPASALLEVLDPEQNAQFLDHYLDVPFDLSQVLFIATANSVSTIPAPLLDRMEVIHLTGYTLEEKESIALRYVIPRELQSHGLKSSQLRIERAALRRMIHDYAREPGLRNLQQLISKVTRKAAAKIVAQMELQQGSAGSRRPLYSSIKTPIVVREDDLFDWLGPKLYHNELLERIVTPGVVVGLAWTSTGGEILFIEAMDLPGTGQLKLTGKMGEVMSESAAIAWSYVRKSANLQLGLPREFFKDRDFHVHIPAGAIPKDGPSAGITMATALMSLLSGRRIRPKVAMSGELSLVGRVLAVGGIKEKVLAAKRAGVQTLILPALNEKDVQAIPAEQLEGLKFHFVRRVEEVFDHALEPNKSKKLRTTLASQKGGLAGQIVRTRTRRSRVKRKQQLSR